jgi:hypothetical protein
MVSIAEYKGQRLDYVKTNHSNPNAATNRLAGERNHMRQLIVQLWRNSAENNWSVRVNDKRSDFIALKCVEQFVAHGLADAKKSLLEPVTKTTH